MQRSGFQRQDNRLLLEVFEGPDMRAPLGGIMLPVILAGVWIAIMGAVSAAVPSLLFFICS